VTAENLSFADCLSGGKEVRPNRMTAMERLSLTVSVKLPISAERPMLSAK
jgi:hypothetical protein